MSDDEITALVSLNVDFGRYEALGAEGRPFFEEHLDEHLQFRRANGSVVDRAGFLDGLAAAGNRTDELRTDVTHVVVLHEQAFVACLVTLRGTRGGNVADGVYRNLRFFERRPDGWRCVQWFNHRAPSHS